MGSHNHKSSGWTLWIFVVVGLLIHVLSMSYLILVIYQTEEVGFEPTEVVTPLLISNQVH